MSKIVGLQANGVRQNIIGAMPSETASIAYTGELLPTGTALYGGISIDATKRYLKNSGKDKTPALVESGQGKFFNGTSQFINTGATPNDTVGTFVTRFTYASGAIQKIMAGMNYSNNRCYMGINASGKIGVGFGANTYDTLFSPDVLVAGQSYHVAFRYSGSEYWLFVDSVLKATGTITGLSSFVGTTFFIGALNNGGTASNYFNSVIDETYYYDVALTDAQIETLYKYPEKVKAYNGAIVPDIGSEANCKLFLPMCENSGSNVVNVAVAPTEITQNSGFDTDTWWVKATNVTISGGKANFNITNASYGGVYKTGLALTIGKIHLITFTVTDYTSGGISFRFAGTTNVSSALYTAVGTYSVMLTPITGNNEIYFYANSGGNFVGSIDNVSVKEITAYPLASYTTAMHTSAAKLSYGAQCTAWKRDSLGVLLGMSNGLSFDGGVSVKGVNTNWVPTYPDNFAIEFIFNNRGVAGSYKKWVFSKANYVQFQDSPTPNSFSVHILGAGSNLTNVPIGYHHVAMMSDGKVFMDGVLKLTLTPTTITSITPLFIGGPSATADIHSTIQGTTKIHKGTQYAKFNIDKAWAKAQKTIAKLGA